MSNLNMDPNQLNQIKNMVGDKNFESAMSQLTPEMIENFSKMMNNSNKESSGNDNSQSQNTNANNTQDNRNESANSDGNGFDFSNLDIGTMMKFKSVLDGMNGGASGSTSNLLNSLKPYLRDEKKGKIDQYAGLLKLANMANVFNPKQGDEKKNE